MKYERPYNRIESRRKVFFGVLVSIVAVVVILIQTIWPHFFQIAFSSVSGPFWRVRYAIEIGAFRSPENIVRENFTLRSELERLRMEYSSSTQAYLLSMNSELLGLLNRASSTSKNLKLASIIARSPTLPNDMFIVDIGFRDGVASTSLIYASDKYLIGRVKEIYPNHSLVTLYSSPEETHDIYIGDGRIKATARGKGGGQYEAFVPHGSVVKDGDIIVNSDIYGRALGQVSRVIRDPSSPFDTVLFVSPINVFESRFVFVDDGKSRLIRR